jgi:hypothetical protein
MMKTELLFLIALLLAVGSCQEGKKAYQFETHFPKSQHRDIMRQLIPRIEKRYEGNNVVKQPKMDSLWLDSCYIEALYAKEDRYYFLYIKKDLITERDDARAVIGSFSIDGEGKLTSVYQDYITYPTPTDVALKNGMTFLKRHVAGKSMEEYTDKQGLIQWPNGMVKFDYEQEKWVY